MFNEMVSIIIPVYNNEKYLSFCLDSVITQTYKNFEVIVINDGSSDNTQEVIQEYCKRDTRITSISKKNEGQGIARNLGFSLAKGKYIYFFDSDDVLHPEAVDVMVREIEESKLDIIYIKYEVFYSDDNSSKFGKIHPGGKIIGPHFALMNLEAMPWLYFFRKEYLDKAGVSFPGYYHEDEAETYRIIKDARGILCINSVLYRYRKHESSTTGLTVGKNTKDILYVVTRLIELSNSISNFQNEFHYKAYSIISSYMQLWAIIEDRWAQELIAKGKPLLDRISKDINDNPYFFIQRSIYSEIEKSISWKITRPLRCLIKLYKTITVRIKGVM